VKPISSYDPRVDANRCARVLIVLVLLMAAAGLRHELADAEAHQPAVGLELLLARAAGADAAALVAVEVAPLVDAAVTLVGELAHRKGLVVHSEIASELPSVWGDPVRLKQILFNLLSNAVKFTPPGGAVRLTAQRICDIRLPIADLAESQSQIANPKSQMFDFVEITVSDTGIGLRAEDLLRLFIPFTQLEDPLRKRHEGTGLGLALTKRLVELHGGTITASSPGEGQGSTFTVVLPVEGGGASTA